MTNNIQLRERIEPFKIFSYLWIFILPWDFAKSIMGIFSIIAIIWWLIIGQRKGYFIKLKDILYNKPLIFFFIFLLYCYLSLSWTKNFSYGLNVLNDYKYYWILVPIFFTAFEKKDVKNAFYVLVFSFCLYALLSLSIFIGLFEIKDSNSSNPKGILAYALVTVYMALNTLLAFYFYIKEENRKIKYIILLISILSFFALLANNGRIGQISFLVTVFILMIYYRSYLFKYKKLLILFIFSFVVTITLIYSFGKLDRFIIGFKEMAVLKETQFAGSWGHRAYMWYAAADGISNHPLFGAGVGDTMDEFIEYGNKNPSKATWLRSYHNQHLDYLTKYGIVGYLLFLFSIFVLLQYLFRENRDFFVIGLIFFSISLIDSVGDNIIMHKPFNNIYALVFVLLAILVSKKKIKTN